MWTTGFQGLDLLHLRCGFEDSRSSKPIQNTTKWHHDRYRVIYPKHRQDMVIQFFTMYPYTTARGIQWEDSLSKIAKHYMRTWFPVDLLTIIPFDIIELSSGVGQVGAFKGTKAIRALRLLKLMRHLTLRDIG